MACKDCMNNCPDTLPDRCIFYTGPELPFLGICPGDSLSEFEAAVAANLQGILDGTGISPANVTLNNCQWLKDRMGSFPPTMSNLFQLLIDASCSLKSLVDQIAEELADNPVFNTACLTGLPANPTRDNILQSAVNLICSMKVVVDAIPTTYVKLSDLTALVTQIVNNLDGGGGDVVQNNTKMVPFSVMAYFGPLSNFDASGKGVANLGFDKIYLCNGSNGTPDLRGRTIVGALKNVPGGSLDPGVDPGVNPNNPDWAIGDRQGQAYHTLSSSEMPVHNHPLNDPGHNHTLSFTSAINAKNQGSTQVLSLGFNPTNPITIADKTGTSTTNVTISSAGGGQPHNNIQPSMAGYYIMYIP